MRKKRIDYDSPVDALVSISKLFSVYEGRYNIVSEEFFDRFTKGKTGDTDNFVEWANDYQHYLALRQEIESQLRHAG